MSVVIKGIDKPKSCFGCDFNMYDCYCKISHGEIDRDDWTCDKPCSIVEVPAPHGRLIDADALLEDVRKNSVSYSADDFAHEWVDVQPTVIEAEGTE